MQAKIELTQQVTALTAAVSTKPISPPRKTETDTATTTSTIETHSVIQTVPTQQPMNSLVVSVPLHNTSLSPSNQILTANATASQFTHLQTEPIEPPQIEASNGTTN